MLVHPDKNMGSSQASESFKKLQCAYEVKVNKKYSFMCFLVATWCISEIEIQRIYGGCGSLCNL